MTKVVTGARSCAPHAFFAESYRRNGTDPLRLGVHPLQPHETFAPTCDAPVVDPRVVSDSGGHREHRWVIEPTVRLGDAEWRVEITSTDRESRLCPKAIAGNK